MSMICSFRKLWNDLVKQNKDEDKDQLKETVDGSKQVEEECVA